MQMCMYAVIVKMDQHCERLSEAVMRDELKEIDKTIVVLRHVNCYVTQQNNDIDYPCCE